MTDDERFSLLASVMGASSMLPVRDERIPEAGGRAIAEVLTGPVNLSGRLPITFPADLAQTPRPECDAC